MEEFLVVLQRGLVRIHDLAETGTRTVMKLNGFETAAPDLLSIQTRI